MSIVWRSLLATSVVFVVALILLTVTPVTISAPIKAVELLILIAGALALLGLEYVLLGRAVAPLRELTAKMSEMGDLRRPPELSFDRSLSRETEALTEAFAAMMDRLSEERRDSTRAVLAAQEGERMRVARELHDEVGQGLTALALQAERAAESSSEPAASQFAELHEALLFNLDEIRRIAGQLRPEMLDDLGLVNALIALADNTAMFGGLTVERDLPEQLDLPAELELVVYRVAQEGLNNAMRHAGATDVSLRLRDRDGELLLEVADNGRGIDPGTDESSGIKGMRERAMLVGGLLELHDRDPRGTLVRLRVPRAARGLQR